MGEEPPPPHRWKLAISHFPVGVPYPHENLLVLAPTPPETNWQGSEGVGSRCGLKRVRALQRVTTFTTPPSTT
eukprot:765118-Hanusia_phi.AAC.2